MRAVQSVPRFRDWRRLSANHLYVAHRGPKAGDCYAKVRCRSPLGSSAPASKVQSLRVVDPDILIHRLAQTFGHSASLRFGLTTTAAPNLMAVSRRSFSDSLTMRAPKT